MSGVAQELRVGAYRIVRLISRGGQGRVYLGYDQRLQRRVAIKVLRAPPERSSRSRILQEARLVASIDSPRVVQIFDVIESPGHLALVMEYVPGCDLRDVLAGGNLSLPAILAVAADVAAALAAARQCQIVHGDLKPANVLISTAGQVKLTDFGISREAGEGSSPGAGSLSALSPEQYRGEPLDVRSDLFSLGCLLYRMISGVPAFVRNGRFDPELLLHEDPVLPRELVADGAELPEELRELLLALLQKDPARRPQNTHEVRKRLRLATRNLPLATASRLLDESRACFRPESANDIPLQIPPDLTLEGRSRLAVSGHGLAGIWSRLGWRAWLAAGGAAAVIVFGLGLLFAPAGETTVHIEVQLLQVDGNIDPPEELSRRWLVEQVRAVAEDKLGPLRVTGPVGATPLSTLYGDDPVVQDAGSEKLLIELRCAQPFCVLDLRRQAAAVGGILTEQLMLFHDASALRWQQDIRSAAQKLYP